ncbi:MAG: hypothetical protein FJ125_00080 [Deltaproteobacteria bacterium]|nr:hypothetical protein [Deltaproteobacteria bacterium]
MGRSGCCVSLASWIDDWGRWLLRTYFTGSIICLVGLCGLLLLMDFPGPYWLAVILATLIVPLLFLVTGLAQRLGALRRGELVVVPVDQQPRPGWRGALSQLRWLLATLAMFAAWPGFYFLASQLGQLSPPTVFTFALDARLPMLSQLTLIYVTMYWFFILPALYGREQEHFWSLLRAYAALMVVCSAVFVLFPVAFPREPLVVRHLGDWTLAIVHGADPPINCFPSSHCAVAILAALAMRDIHPPGQLPALALALGICLATVFTKQHYVVDTLAGMLLGGGAYLYFFRPGLRQRLRQTILARLG